MADPSHFHGHRLRWGRGHLVEQGAPERREDAIATALLRSYLARRRKHRSIVEHEIEPLRHGSIRDLPPRLVMHERMDPLRLDFAGEPYHFVGGRPAPEYQQDAFRRKISAQCGQAMVQPPALRRAHFPRPWCLVVQDIKCDDRPLCRGGGEGGLVGQAEVLAKPDDRGGHHRHTNASSRRGCKRHQEAERQQTPYSAAVQCDPSRPFPSRALCVRVVVCSRRMTCRFC